jgi:uncharacterized membrane protein YeaQ/YmgE (transglycosylase-associated protein family)
MYFLSWVIVGLVTGWLTGKLVREGGYGPIVNIVMGIAGAVAGGFIARLASSELSWARLYELCRDFGCRDRDGDQRLCYWQKAIRLTS